MGAVYLVYQMMYARVVAMIWAMAIVNEVRVVNE